LRRRTGKLTTTINIILRLRNLLPIHNAPDPRLLTNIPVAFTQNHDFIPRNLVLLDRFADDLLADTVAVHVRRVPGVEAAVVSGFQQGEGFLFVDDPGLPGWVAETHGAEDGDGDAQAAGAEAFVGCFCFCDGAEDWVGFGGAIGSRHFGWWRLMGHGLLVARGLLGVGERKVGELYYLIFPWAAHARITVATWRGVRQMVCSVACMDDVVLLTIDCVVSEGSRTLTPQTPVEQVIRLFDLQSYRS
jgi:hypothetical protein